MGNFRTTFTAMGGDNELVVVANDQQHATSAMEAAAKEVLRIQDKYSRYRTDDGSIIHRINSRAGNGEWIECDEETLSLFRFANQIYRHSDGLFDITSGVLRKAWDFKQAVVPDEETIAKYLELVDWTKLEIGENTVRLRGAGMEVDFGGFGKEYAADRAGRVLREQGITSGYVNLGGDICAIGPQAGGEDWLIGVENPREQGAIIATIPVSQGGLATSGDAVKYFIKNDRRYCHIINPKTGWPVHCWSSVSISQASTLRAGVYSTVAMLKEDKAERFLVEQGCGYLLVDLQGQKFLNQPPIQGETEI